MATRRELTVIEANKKRNSALITGGLTFIASAIFFKIFWILGLIALIFGGSLTLGKVRQWLQYRGENGLYF